MPSKHPLQYSIEDAPPIHVTILLGFQQFLTMMGGSIAMPLIVAEASCVGPDLVGRAQIMGTLMFVNGLATLLQLFFGVRLPILQGASFGFVVPMMAMQHLEGHQCPTAEDYASWKIFPGSSQHRNLWMSRLVEIQGAILLAGVLETIIGSLGLVSVLFRFLGPLTIAPTMALIELSLIHDVIFNYAAKFWPIALLSMSMVLLCVLYLPRVGVPIPVFSFTKLVRERKFECCIAKVRLFSLFPVLLSIMISWGIYALLTLTNALPEKVAENHANSTGTLPDIYMSELSASPWFRIPYPGQWGTPTINVALTIGMFAAVISSIIESIGDYCVTARLCGAALPPSHALNRGIAVEGLGCILAGAFGCGPGVTSYSENVGAISITGVGSRRVTFVAAIVLLVFGCFTKLATFFVLIPEPIIGGILIAILSLVAAVGISNLQYVDLNSTRNLLIFGLSIFLGLGIPEWIVANRHLIKTGSEIFDQVVIVLLSTGMFVGGFIGFVLDNTVPKDGDDGKEFGSDIFHSSSPTSAKTYDLPFNIGDKIKNIPFFNYIPICPTFQSEKLGTFARELSQRRLSFRHSFRRNSKNSNNSNNNPLPFVAAPGDLKGHPSNVDIQSSDVPSVGTVNEAFDHSSISRTASVASLTLSFAGVPYISASPRMVPLASESEEKWTDL